MRVVTLALEDFRNYRDEKVSLDPGVNLILGRNAQGKTNLLEAVHCLSGLGSPRGVDSNLVMEGRERALLHGEVERSNRRVQIDMEIRPGRGTRCLVNGTPVSGTKALREVAISVYFGPDDLSLVKGAPELRRRFIDDLVVKLRPAREALRREWDRVLRQRNALLRSMPREQRARAAALETLEVWDESFCRSGAALTASRLEVVAELAPFGSKRYEAIAGGGGLALGYESKWVPLEASQAALVDPKSVTESELRVSLAEKLSEARERELERGISLVGPQRDDLVLLLSTAHPPEDRGPLDARAFASQGDQRTTALALKLGEHDLLTQALSEEPILLLDDVFSELDPARRQWLAETVRGSGQTLISSAEPLMPEVTVAARTIEVTAGRISVQ